MPTLTPMMQQYMDIKEQYPDCILMCRLGDFYEMFFDDALTAAKELSITLTGKACGLLERAPMCGVPHHAVEGYLTKLVNKGYKVAICDQVEDPKQAKGIVRREVTRVVSAGTNLNIQSLDEAKNNYICCIAYFEGKTGLAFTDITTGDFHLTEAEDNRKITDEIAKYSPTEIVANDAFLLSGIDINDLKNRQNIMLNTLEPKFFSDESCIRCLKDHFKVADIKALSLADYPLGTIAAGALLLHLYDTQKTSLGHILHLNPYHSASYMLLDSATRRNLELTETLRDKQKKGSLLWVLDKTKTAMGARALRGYLEQPLKKIELMEERLDAIAAFCENSMIRDEIREYLHPIYDLERLLSKISYQSVTPRDLIAFRNSITMLAPIKIVLSNLDTGLLKKLLNDLSDHKDILDLLNNAINEEAPLNTKEGGIIKNGFDPDIDRLRNAKSEGKTWLAELEASERERTGIKNLKVKYNKVFGYYFEVTNSNLTLIPDDYQRKQTLANAERYTNPRLKELEDLILNAEDKLYSLEYDRFCEIRDFIANAAESVQKTAKSVAALDAVTSLAYISEHNRFVRPVLNEKGYINIKNGRHPVVEQMLDNGLFIENDTHLDNDKNCIAVITGPNMAGKSTYMRQTALIVLLAQIGCFVPAEKADISIVDRIFTRVGASDDLASGQSTFMVEMNEVANILKNATGDSLLILDEIGRGTSTYDGLAIAWAVIEHISNRRLLGAKTLFATHYHELTELEGKIDNVNNYCIAVREKGDDIVFLRKIIKGGADRSYGIQVAKLAGVPDLVTDRAIEIAALFDDSDITKRLKDITVEYKNDKKTSLIYDEVDLTQMTLFDTVKDEDVLSELKQIDVSTLTPLDALNTIYRLQNLLNNRYGGG
ncbi:MAG: DNA mismatch repair protein MutS [Lachnospiraceae bacterium]|nr:DNA mismatch repair protein MutS [Lachnospiraceae bacterium]